MSKLYVTKPFLPPKEQFLAYVEEIYESNVLTNNGPLLLELEEKLSKRFDTNLYCVANGTLALQLALRFAGDKGEVITTPYSYAATTNSIVWEKLRPVFVDVNRENGIISAELVEKEITKDTIAILATHVYGIPCDVEKLEGIAKKHNLLLIFDSAHAFDVMINGESILKYGDINCLSFHATKLFHTFEGGACSFNSKDFVTKFKLYRAFGHDYENHLDVGINAKMSEIHAAMGLSNFLHIDNIKNARGLLVKYYDSAFEHYNQKFFRSIRPTSYAGHNFSYYPIIVRDEKLLLPLIHHLNSVGIYPRRYFWPALNKLSHLAVPTRCDNAEYLAARVVALPLYESMSTLDADRVIIAISDFF